MSYAESFMGKEESDKLYADTREAVLAQGKTEAMADDIARVTVNCTRAQRGWAPGKSSKQYFAFARRTDEQASMEPTETIFVMDESGETQTIPLTVLIQQLQDILASIPEADRALAVVAIGSPGGDALLTIDDRR